MNSKEEYWKNKGIKKQYTATCPTCGKVYQYPYIHSVVKCNACGYEKPPEKDDE